MKLYAKIYDRCSYKYERVVLCQFKDEDENKCYIQEVEMDGEDYFKIVIDEGYVKTEHFLKLDRYSISELSIYE